MSEAVRIWGPLVMFARPAGPPFLRLFSIAGDLTRFLKGFIVRFLGQNELAEAARGLATALALSLDVLQWRDFLAGRKTG